MQNKTKYFHSRLFTTLFYIYLFVGVGSFAQQDTELENKEIIINKEVEKILPDATRNFEKINFDVPRENYPPQKYIYETNYKLNQNDIRTKFKLPTMKEEELSKLYGNYLKAGFGNYVTPYFELMLNNKRSEKFAYGAKFKHLSSKNGPVENSGTSTNDILLYAKYIGKTSTLESTFDFQRDVVRFYGYDQVISRVNSDTIKQVFSMPSFKVLYKGKALDSALSYQLEGRVNTIADNFGSKENDFGVKTIGSYILNNKNSSLLWNVDASFIQRKELTELNRHLIKVMPSYKYNYGKYSFIGGFNAAIANDTISSSKSFHLYPVASVEARLVPNKLSAFLGLGGDLEKNTFRSIVLQMPYLAKHSNFSNSNKKIDIYLGAKTNITEILYTQVKASYRQFQNLYFFTNDLSDSARFNVVYEKGNTNNLQLNLEAGISKKKVQSTLMVVYNTYQMDGLKAAYHRPALSATWNTTFQWKEKVYFNLDFYYISGIKGRKAQIFESQVDLKDIVDINFKADYLLSKRSSLFLAVNNILGNRYQRFLYYQNKGTNILIGATFAF